MMSWYACFPNSERVASARPASPSASFPRCLKAPVESSGTLIFRAPDLLEKRTVEPQRESVRIEGNVVTYEGAPLGGNVQKRTFALSDAPLLAALIESLRARWPVICQRCGGTTTCPGARRSDKRGGS